MKKKNKKKISKKMLIYWSVNIPLVISLIISMFNSVSRETVVQILVGAMLINAAIGITGNVGYALQRSIFFNPELKEDKEGIGEDEN